MDENAVRVIVQEVNADYEKTTGKPRHEENLKKFDRLFNALSWIKGAAWTFGALMTIVEIYSKLHGN